jgi:D-cysteine desulfhydrase
VTLGTYPSPVRRLGPLTGTSAELFVKDDGATHPLFGGNKVRKFEPLLLRALGRGARRLLTIGAAGAHHAVAAGLAGRHLGLPVTAVVCSQPWSQHAEDMLRAALALGVEVVAAPSAWRLPARTAQVLRRGDYLLPPGGTNVASTACYGLAAAELAEQVRAGLLPEPDVVVVPLGTGGTAAGLLAGLVVSGLKCELIAVTIAKLGVPRRPLVLGLAASASLSSAGRNAIELSRRLFIDDASLGEGYGIATPAGDLAQQEALDLGLVLDPAYTAKAFATVLGLVGRPGFDPPRLQGWQAPRNRPLRVLYWHTLSSAPPELLLAGAPPLHDSWNSLLPRRPSRQPHPEPHSQRSS